MMRTRVSTLLVLSLAATAVAQGETFDLKTTAKKGSAVWIQQEAKSENNIDMGGMQMDMGSTTTYTVLITVKDVAADGTLSVEAKIGRIQGSFTVPQMGDVDYDSAEPGEGEEEGIGALGTAMASIAGQSFTAQVDPYGQVKSMDGLKAILDGARGKGGMMGQMLGGQLQDGNFERLVESAFGAVPEKPIQKGGTFVRNEDAKASRARVSNKITMTLAEIDAEAFTVTAAGTIEKPSAEPTDGAADESPMDKQNREMLAKMKIENGKITGTSKVSRQDGFVVESKSEMSMEITMPSPMGGGEMFMTQKTTTTTKRSSESATKKAEPAKKVEKAEPAKDGK